MKKLCLLVLSYVMFVPLLAAAETPAPTASHELKALLQQAKSLQGNFEQKLFDREGHLLQTTKGKFVVQRPGNFYWETLPPYEQIVVGSPTKLWVYDPDLEQVTVHTPDQSPQMSPAQILSGELETLDDYYRVTRENKDGVKRFTLVSKNDEGMFARLQMDYRNGQLAALQFEDTMGQVTDLAFADIQMNPKVDPAIFKFEVPPGVDVIVDD